MTSTLNPEALAALKNYTQADDDGVMVNVSRQALDEAIAALTSTQQGHVAWAVRTSRLAMLAILFGTVQPKRSAPDGN